VIYGLFQTGKIVTLFKAIDYFGAREKEIRYFNPEYKKELLRHKLEMKYKLLTNQQVLLK